MSFFRNAVSVWKSLRANVRPVPRGRKRPAPVDTLEVRALLAGEFTDLGALGLPAVEGGAAAWGDYDNDGKLDVLITGTDSSNTEIAGIFRNNGDNTFTDIHAGLTGVSSGAVAWGDMDNDNDLDILLTGHSSEDVTRVYRNDGNGMFTDISAGLTGVSGGAVAWGDADNDGDLDILLTGQDFIGQGGNTQRVAQIYRNNGDNTFTDINAGLTGVNSSAVAWADFDKDGDQDILLTGIDNDFVVSTKIYQNNGDSTFTDINANLPNVRRSSVACGDYDNDGDLDIALAGDTDNSALGNGNPIAGLFENNGDGTFTDLNAGLPGVRDGSVAWGDYDNDGYLDVLLVGRDSSDVAVSRLYKPEFLGAYGTAFTEIDAGLVQQSGSAMWADFDGSGSLDILIVGDGDAKGYRNDVDHVNFAPYAPIAHPAEYLSPTTVKFSWFMDQPYGDLDTPDAGLTYNLIIGTSPGGSDVFSTMAKAADGSRRVPARGPIQGTSFTLTNATPGTKYYWSVQAIDASFAGGSFSVPAVAEMPSLTDLGAGTFANVYRSSVTWGDYDRDGDLDVLLAGKSVEGGTTALVATVYRNDGGEVFTPLDAGLAGVYFSAAAWGDYDNDGDLDILLTGAEETGYATSKVYRNNGDSTFTDINAGLHGVDRGASAWADYDNDGDLDVLITGRDDTALPISKLYRNNGDSTFTGVEADLTPVEHGAVAWGDFDNDGDLDLLLSGLAQDSIAISRLYQNNADGTFTDINTSQFDSHKIIGVHEGSVAWGDYDNDGDLDILSSGLSFNGAWVSVTLVYENEGAGAFTSHQLVVPSDHTLSGSFGPAAWADFNSDGFLDIVVSGLEQNQFVPGRVLLNDTVGGFGLSGNELMGVDFSSLAAADYDNDGDVDLILMGLEGGTVRTSLYRNEAVIHNTIPAAPTELNSAKSAATSLTFTWAGAHDAETYVAGLSYNLRVGTTPDGSDVFTTMAGSDGLRRVAHAGPIQGTSYTLKNLVPGTLYYWSVQAIDTSFAGGAFAAEQIGYLDAPPVIAGTLTSQAVNDEAAVAPFASLTLNDPGNFTPILVNITITDGVNRGDFTPASTAGWTRALVSNDIKYSRSFGPSVTAVQSAIRGLVFQPRSNALVPGATELTNFTVIVDDQFDSATDTNTSVVTKSVNNAPIIGGAVANQAVNDNSTNSPFSTLTVADPDVQGMTATIRIINGLVRGDFTSAAVTGWTRTLVGNDINYSRSFGSTANVGATVQAAVRALVFRPRENAIPPGTTESTSFTVTLADGVAAPVSNSATTVVTTSLNNVPAISGANGNATVNDNATTTPFSTLTVMDPDNQALLGRVTILNGVVRGDFTAGASAGWIRSTSGNNIVYTRSFVAAGNNGAVVQAAIRALVYQPRSNTIKPNTSELTDFTVFVSDGPGQALNSGTRVNTASVNDAPTFGGTTTNVAVNDNATVNPFTVLTVTDVDMQEMLISATILNGTVRGDFTPASTADWAVRYVLGNNITYKRYFSPQANVGAAAQAAFRALVFQPRQNAIKPGTTEATDFQVTVSDGVAPAVLGTGTRVTTTSVNNAPTIAGTVANQPMNDNQTKAVFSTVTVTDPDNQDQFVRLTITSGTTRGDFTSASATGWTRKTSGANIVYERFFTATTNSGATVQAAIRALLFQPRTNVPVGTSETTSFTVFINDGLANVTNSATSVITTGVAPREFPTVPSSLAILDADTATIVVPSIKRPPTNSLGRLLKRADRR